MNIKNYVIGLDYGSDSVRAVLVHTESGKEEACKASQNQFRQHPLDHVEGLENTIKEVLLAKVKAKEEIDLFSQNQSSNPF